ncbi:purine-binding chemotaxis protein CheW [Clostridium tetanomorphum]|uniref:Purine-binding chemotaxis protein CheW n=1 Tax=Clostridium tetanomorphum TaxID=1553 RepID=A0A923E8C4_CLOTT|nr:chemotaxis protein CheW [Clostridium tetanomorphum]KAJ53493.1 chemotaxis protein cheW [Clostridium tetanomorphum DSM 665]MBC2398432.1 purine-binding chemotaxis protein CheW [Clostridium tetanomorphum]MBP1865274.1 purine-binding chemotaxis protein CheW [Clostridium tetanomorphum]NRS85197.1 purine-binding chemotaxis protein CheW [Clostridium tetanomorphum]NRZ98376.1 purine-binding chemotaxis protein CheW [Clostridium tetanomorphum]
MQVVIFKLSDEQFAVETAKVQSINDMMEITKVPNAPAHIKGLINLRGNIISLLDINLLLDVNGEGKEQSNIIILDIEEEMVGITVDQVDEVLDVEEELIEKLDEDRKKAYIKGVINFKDRVVTLIDIDRLLSN